MTADVHRMPRAQRSQNPGDKKVRWDKKVQGEPSRPFRLWDAKLKKNLRWRYYSTAQRAHLGALIECRWAPVGTVIEVYNVIGARFHGQYKRTPNSVQFNR
jgi:hypothetical protein